MHADYVRGFFAVDVLCDSLDGCGENVCMEREQAVNKDVTGVGAMMKCGTNWRRLIGARIKGVGESWADVVACTLSEDELDVVFNDGFGWAEGKPFTVWTHKHVFFPVDYDGAESVGCVSRDPDGKATMHI